MSTTIELRLQIDFDDDLGGQELGEKATDEQGRIEYTERVFAEQLTPLIDAELTHGAGAYLASMLGKHAAGARGGSWGMGRAHVTGARVLPPDRGTS